MRTKSTREEQTQDNFFITGMDSIIEDPYNIKIEKNNLEESSRTTGFKMFTARRFNNSMLSGASRSAAGDSIFDMTTQRVRDIVEFDPKTARDNHNKSCMSTVRTNTQEARRSRSPFLPAHLKVPQIRDLPLK